MSLSGSPRLRGTHLLRRGLDRLHDVDVSRAHAQVPRYPFPDLLLAGSRVVSQKVVGCEEHARGAVPALEAVVLPESLLYRVELRALRQSFDRQYLGAIDLLGEEQARLHQFPVQDDGAGSALADNAADVRAREPQLVPEEIGQEGPRLGAARVLLTVDGQADLPRRTRHS